jgi:hypothetical protein
MTQDEIIEMARQAGFEHIAEANYWHPLFAKFAKLVEEHVRKTIDDEAKAHLEELRKNFDAESAELRLHQWASHGGLWIEDLWKHQDKNT